MSTEALEGTQSELAERDTVVGSFAEFTFFEETIIETNCKNELRYERRSGLRSPFKRSSELNCLRDRPCEPRYEQPRGNCPAEFLRPSGIPNPKGRAKLQRTPSDTFTGGLPHATQGILLQFYMHDIMNRHVTQIQGVRGQNLPKKSSAWCSIFMDAPTLIWHQGLKANDRRGVSARPPWSTSFYHSKPKRDGTPCFGNWIYIDINITRTSIDWKLIKNAQPSFNRS